MRITPLEIRQRTFDKSFRGYDAESVDAFLLSLSQEWERVGDELRMAKQQLEASEREINRIKEIESSLFKTIKVAEEAQREINEKAQLEANKVIETAQAEADYIVKQASQEVDGIHAEAKRQANMVISDAENKAAFMVEEAEYRLQSLERDTKALERYKELLVNELKKFASETLEKVAKFEERTNLPAVTPEAESVAEPVAAVEPVVTDPTTTVQPIEAVLPTEEPTASEPTAESEVGTDEEEFELPTVSTILQQEELPTADLPSFNTFLQEEANLDESYLGLPPIASVPTALVDELPTAVEEEKTELKDELKEANALKSKIKKIANKDVGLPTVSSVMEELKKDSPGNISNGGGSFFDNF